MADFSFQNKTVVLMIKFAVLGGAERQALGLADFLIKEYDCKVHLIITHLTEPTKEFNEFAISCGIDKIHYFGKPSLTIRKDLSLLNMKRTIKSLLYINKMKREVSKFKPDILIPFLNTPSKIAVLIYKKTGAKFTFWHQLGLDSHSFDLLENKAVNLTPFVIANAENGLDIFRDKYNVPKEKLFILPQYVSIKKIELNKEDLKKSFGIPNDAVVVGMIAHYRLEKYQGLLLQAFSEIETNKKIHLVFLGNKDNNEQTLYNFNNLKDIVIEKNYIENVTILSGQSVEQVLNCLDIGVLVSEIEGTPNVVMEYMLYGLPIITTHHSGCKALLGTSDFLIPNDKNILKEKLTNLIDNHELRLIEGKMNSEKIKHFSIENYVKSFNNIINSFS